MRILLVNPPWILRKGNVWRNLKSIMPPLGLAWMAAVLENEGHEVKILDAHAERVDLNKMAFRLNELAPYDLIGLTSTTALIGNALEVAAISKSEFPHAKVVLGGVHPTVLPDQVLADDAVDIVVRGEGERTIIELAAEKSLEDIAGISFLSDGQAVHNRDRELMEDLDLLPFPAYHLLPMERYYPAVGASRRTPAISILATRGCPGRCTFCYRIYGRSLRFRSGVKVAEEVKLLQERYGIREICFYDDTFTANKKEVAAFCQALDDLKIDLTWNCFSRIDNVDENLLLMMKEAGCHQIMYGIEAASPVIIKNINKKINLEQVEKAVKMTKRFKIDVRAAFMLGNPGETEETMKETLKFAIKLNPEITVWNITTPFPGTEMFTWAEENGYLITKDWEDYSLSTPILELPTISSKKVQDFYWKAYRKFYLRPRYIIMRLWKIRSMTDFFQAVRGFRAILNF